MALLDTLNYYLQIILGVTLFLSVAIVGVLYYLLKVKKITAKEEKINYDNFERRNALDYVKFENIESEDTNSMMSPGIIEVGNNRFVAGINVNGYNFSTASASERMSTMANMISFFNVVDVPIQLRQTVTSIDITHNIEQYQAILSRLSMEGLALQEEYDETIRLADDCVDVPEDYDAYQRRIRQLRKSLDAKKHAVNETKELIGYMKTMVGGQNRDSNKINQIMFSYVYNPDEYMEELSPAEIRLKAFRELDTKGKSFINALTLCGCQCKRISAADLVLLLYKHNHPLSSDDLKLEDLFNSSYNSLFITSDSLIELEKERIGEEEQKRLILQFQQVQEDLLNKQVLEAERTKQVLFEQASELAKEQMQVS